MPRRPTMVGAGGPRDGATIGRAAVESDNQQELTMPAGSSWTARYGEVAIRDGMATIPWALYAYQGLLGMAAPEVWFISAILAHRWDAQLPHPSLKQMAVQSGVSLRQLQKLRAVLCEKLLLEVRERQGSNGAQQANSYDFAGLFARLDAAILDDEPPTNQIADDDAPPALDPADHSFVGRYGRVLAGAGVVAVPRGLYAYQATLDLSPQDCWFITYILAHKWTGELPYPSLRKMAERTGYSVKQLHSIKDGLVERGLLRLVQRYDNRGGRAANGYDFAPLLASIVELLRAENIEQQPTGPVVESAPMPSRRGRRSAPANGPAAGVNEGAQRASPGGMQNGSIEGMQSSTTGRMTRSSYGGVQNSSHEEVNRTSLTGMRNGSDGGMQSSSLARMHNGSLPGGAEQYPVGDAEGFISRGAESNSGRGAENGGGGGAESFTRRRKAKADQDQAANDSNRSAAEKQTLPYSPYIAQVVQDYSAQMSDGTHWTSNVTQALRLWQQSELDEDGFVTLMHTARRLVREYQGKQGAGVIGNKMAYYFQVLRSAIEDSVA